jgi:hypothetical protein
MANVHDIRDAGANRPAGPTPDSRNAGLWLALLVGWGLAIAFFILLCMWGWGPHNAGGGGGYAMETPTAILNNPAQFTNHAVTVAGVVDDVLAPQQFTIGGNGADNELLIFTPPSAVAQNAQPVAKGEVVQAEGRIRMFDRAAAEREYHIQVPANIAERFAGKPVLVVDHLLASAPEHQAASR